MYHLKHLPHKFHILLCYIFSIKCILSYLPFFFCLSTPNKNLHGGRSQIFQHKLLFLCSSLLMLVWSATLARFQSPIGEHSSPGLCMNHDSLWCVQLGCFLLLFCTSYIDVIIFLVLSWHSKICLVAMEFESWSAPLKANLLPVLISQYTDLQFFLIYGPYIIPVFNLFFKWGVKLFWVNSKTLMMLR